MSSTAVYPGTFDPITHGHTDVIARASRLFDRLVVAVVMRPNKSTQLDADQRLDLAQQICKPYSTVTVQAFDGLLVEFAQSMCAKAIVRGVRTAADFDYEAQMALINRGLASQLETVILPAAPETAQISSSLVREVARLGGDISAWVDSRVEAALMV